MKTLPAIISIATIAALLLLAVAASVIESIPFAYIATCVIGFAVALELLALFVADYGPQPPRLIAVEQEKAQAEREAAARASETRRRIEREVNSPAFNDEASVNWVSTAGLRNEPSTLSLL